MSTKIDLLLPVGRFVRGSLYDVQNNTIEGQPRLIKTGINAGQPANRYFFAVAFQKKHSSWQETEWGKKIFELAKLSFPKGQYLNPTFSWKIQDGDSEIPNKAGKRNVDIEGYAGHWVLNFSTSLEFKITRDNGHSPAPERGAVQLGDYIEVYANVSSNNSIQQPGVYLNPRIVNFAGHGKRIFVGVDATKVGFGQSEKPEGLSDIPLRHEQILTPRTLTSLADGVSYEDLIKMGWTDETLIEKGLMLP